jgi:hypothetical protein
MNKTWLCVWWAAGIAAMAGWRAEGADARAAGIVPAFAAAAGLRQSNDVPATAGGNASDVPPALSLTDSRVVIPYPELKALLESALRGTAQKKEVPPVEAALVSAHFALHAGGDAPGLEARFAAAAFGEGWRLVPLVGCDVAPSAIEPRDADVVARDGVYCALIRGPSRASVTLRFDGVGPRRGAGTPLFRLETQPATASTLAVDGLGEGERLRVVGLPHPIDGARDIPLPSAGATLELFLEEDKPPVPSRWAANAVVLVERDEAFLRYAARLIADAVEGDGGAMVLELPEGSREIAVEGAGISRRELVADTGGPDRLEIAWADGGTRSREVNLRWRTPPRGETDRWPLACPRPQGARTFEAIFVAARPDATALDVDPPSAALAGVTLPAWTRERLGARDHVVVTEGAALLPRRLQVAEAERATVRSFKCMTTVIRDGSALGEGIFEIEHAGALRWKVSLPEGARLLKCAANGAAAQPVLGEDGGLEFLLPANPKGISQVFLSYTGKEAAMDPVGGRLSLRLPSTPLFADRIEWHVTLPQAYEVTAADGNLEVGKGDGEALALEKRLCRGEIPSVDLHYRKRAPRE